MSCARIVEAKTWNNESPFSIRSPGKKARKQTLKRLSMRFQEFSFGSIRIDGVMHENDVLIDHGKISKRKKKASKKFRDDFGHTPLSLEEEIPWKCRRLVIGIGAYGRLPVMKGVKREAEHRKVELIILPTEKAIKILKDEPEGTNAILHVTC